MRFQFLKYIAILFLATRAYGQATQFCDPTIVPNFTTSPRAGLQIPRANACGWDVPANATFNILDQEACYNNIACDLAASQILFASLPAVSDGNILYCTDCTANSSPCSGSGTGSFAVRTGGTWQCTAGAAVGTTSTTSTSTSTSSSSTSSSSTSSTSTSSTSSSTIPSCGTQNQPCVVNLVYGLGEWIQSGSGSTVVQYGLSAPTTNG